MTQPVGIGAAKGRGGEAAAFTWQPLNDALRTRVRHRDSRKEGPSRAVASRRPSRADKKVNGRKHHLVVDTLGMVAAVVQAAPIQDRTEPPGKTWSSTGMRNSPPPISPAAAPTTVPKTKQGALFRQTRKSQSGRTRNGDDRSDPPSR